tara:strand:+ start:12674 stop:13660 length:987 start_codon:yes stop_codon:yes gene_type:complete
MTQSKNKIEMPGIGDLSEQGNHVVNYEAPKNFYWIHGLEEYMEYIDHHQMEVFQNIKKAILHGNIWKIKRLINAEVTRGKMEHTEEFINILLARFIGWEYSTHRKVLQYISHCIDNSYIRKISSWSIKWEDRANLNDHFSRGQIRSKMWLVDKLAEVFEDRELGTVVHYGGWYATIAHILFEFFHIKQYLNLELDPECVDIADDFNYEHLNNWRYKTVQLDCGIVQYNTNGEFDIDIVTQSGIKKSTRVKPDIIINTSCEHMNEDWFHNLPTGQVVCLQTNDYFSNEQHSNCCKDLDEVKAKYPMSKTFYSGELDTQLYNRFMLIGTK